MKTARAYTAIIEQDDETGLFVAYVPDLPGAHTQAETLEELRGNLEEVIALVLEDDSGRRQKSHFVGTQQVVVA